MASLMEELIATLQNEMAAYQEMLPVAEEKTYAIISNDLQKLQQITDLEQETIYLPMPPLERYTYRSPYLP